MICIGKSAKCEGKVIIRHCFSFIYHIVSMQIKEIYPLIPNLFCIQPKILCERLFLKQTHYFETNFQSAVQYKKVFKLTNRILFLKYRTRTKAKTKTLLIYIIIPDISLREPVLKDDEIFPGADLSI